MKAVGKAAAAKRRTDSPTACGPSAGMRSTCTTGPAPTGHGQGHGQLLGRPAPCPRPFQDVTVLSDTLRLPASEKASEAVGELANACGSGGHSF